MQQAVIFDLDGIIIRSKNVQIPEVVDGIPTLLRALREQNISCGIYTDIDRERTTKLLKRVHLDKHFQVIICAGESDRLIPAANRLEEGLCKLNIMKEQTVIVGAGVNVILCAKAAKVFVIAAAWGEESKQALQQEDPDLLADSVDQLKNYILKKEKLLDDFVFSDQTVGGQKVRNSDPNDILDKVYQCYDTAILRLNGVEHILNDKLIQFVKRQSVKYKAIQITTNGLSLNEEVINQLKELTCICIQLSLNHHTLAGNNHKGITKQQLDQILYYLDLIVESKIPIEVNCELTDSNLLVLNEFAEYLMKYRGRAVMLMPFLTEKNREVQNLIDRTRCQAVEKLLMNYHLYADILPPIAYLEGLLDVVKNGKRRTKSYIPQVINRISDYDMRSREKSGQLSNLFINTEDSFKEYTKWEIFNLYIDDLISLEELIQVPLYRFISVRNHLVNLKQIKY